MKKYLLLHLTIFSIAFSVQAQIPINDTLRYFTYKQRYKLPVSPIHPYYKDAAASPNSISHVGSVFKNKQNLQILGLEVKVLKNPVTVTTDTIPIRLYLCNVVNGLPVFPPVDSVFTGAENTTDLQFGRSARGTFTASAVRIVTGDFAVLAKCVSLVSGDTLKILRTSGHTNTSTAVPLQQRFGEGLGVVRQAGVFYKTTNYNHPQFGNGTDYEFCVAPIVTFSLEVNQIASSVMDGVCECEVFTNTNTSTPALTNRQFNFNEFYRKLKPFDPSMPAFNPDSVLAWDMGEGKPPFYLPPNADTIRLYYWSGVANMFFTGNIKGNYKDMSRGVNAVIKSDTLVFLASVVWCNTDTTGCFTTSFIENNALSKTLVFPNPVSDKITISHLNGKNIISLYNITGEILFQEITSANDFILPVEDLANGLYLLKITNTENQSRIVKVLKM